MKLTKEESEAVVNKKGGYLTEEECPKCGSLIRAKGIYQGGGIECTGCNYWFCY